MLLTYLVISICGLSFIAAFFSTNSAMFVILFTLGLCGLVLGAITTFFLWAFTRSSGTESWLHPCFIAVAFIASVFVISPLKGWLNQCAFEGNLQKYNNLVAQIKSRTITVGQGLGPVPGKQVQELLSQKQFLATPPAQIVAARSANGDVLFEVSLVS